MTTFSLVAAAYRSEDYVGALVDSVRAQTRTDWELIVVDDGSPDDLATEVEQRTDDPRVRLIRLPENRGVSAARNAGAAAASGRYIVVVDSDDMLRHDFLERMGERLATIGRLAMAGCTYQVVDSTGRPTQSRPLPAPLPSGGDPEATLLWLLGELFQYGPVSVLERAVFEQIGGYDEHLWFGEDWDLWVRATASTRGQVVLIDEPIYIYRHHLASVTGAIERETANYTGHLQALDAIAAKTPSTPARRKALRTHRRRIHNLLHAAHYRTALQADDAAGARQAARALVRLRPTPGAWAKLAVASLPRPARRRITRQRFEVAG